LSIAALLNAKEGVIPDWYRRVIDVVGSFQRMATLLNGAIVEGNRTPFDCPDNSRTPPVALKLTAGENLWVHPRAPPFGVITKSGV
jgi:hypothetical protein